MKEKMTYNLKLNYIFRKIKSAKWFEAGWATQQDLGSKQNKII